MIINTYKNRMQSDHIARYVVNVTGDAERYHQFPNGWKGQIQSRLNY